MKVCVTGATGFVGAHVARALAQRGGEVLFHVVGDVASGPKEHVWLLNARGPDIAVLAAAADRRATRVPTSTISAIGVANGNGSADIEVVVVNPAYVLGVPVNRSQPGETSTRTVGNYLRGRLPGVIDAPMNFVDVEDVAAGHLLAADRGAAGERYILGGVNLRWPHLIDRVAKLSGVRYPIIVLPRATGRAARVREALGLPGAISAEAFELMGQDWRFTSQRARDELGYRPRPLDRTMRATIDWYLELIEAGAFNGSASSGLSRWADSMQMASRLGLLTPVRVGQRIVGRRLVVGG